MLLSSEFVVAERFVSPAYVTSDLLLNSPKLYLLSGGVVVSVLAELMRKV